MLGGRINFRSDGIRCLQCPLYRSSFAYKSTIRSLPFYNKAPQWRHGHVSSSSLSASHSTTANAPQSPLHHQFATLSSADDILSLLNSTSLPDLMSTAAELRDIGHPYTITFSPKVFIPLTRLCRDACGYCTFAQGPVPGRRVYMTIEEVLTVARMGAERGCTEALFTLGDKPELKYPEAAAELASLGYSSTIEFVKAAAEAVLEETGLMPHINAGVMTREEVHALRAVSVSQGLMLESLSEKLLDHGQPHFNCPDKEPSPRLAMLEAAGEEHVPFTTGILVGIGETRKDRIEALLEIKKVHERYNHVQEVIIQNFRAKKGTLMEKSPEPALEELLWTVAAARLVLGPHMSIQAPPNLTPESDDAQQAQHDSETSWKLLIDAGINDWGGVSPLTRDFVNPERPWPHVLSLAAATAATGKVLAPRLPVYPQYLTEPWLDGKNGAKSPLAIALKNADVHGLARASSWYAGAVDTTNATALLENFDTTNSDNRREGEEVKKRATALPRASAFNQAWKISLATDGLLLGSQPQSSPSNHIESLLSTLISDNKSASYEPTLEDIELLFSARGVDYEAVVSAADALRQRMNGDTVSFVVNRNINYTNVCTFGCKFCAFSKGPAAEELRGAPYLLPLEEVTRRTAEAWSRGATEVCMQGGIHPDFTGETYLNLVAAAKAGAQNIHVHAFSPLEVSQGALTLGWSLSKYLTALKDAGLGSLPGTAAEVLDDAVRAELCPDKLSTSEWLEVVQTAHSVGLKTTSTIMFGHVDSTTSWARHLLALRNVAKSTGMISEFVPLPFVHMEAPMYRKGRARAGPTLRESVLMHAVARLVLHPHVTNIQASWVKMGPERAADLLRAGCNDMGGTLMNESITRAAGAAHGQELGPIEMEELIRAAGRVPMQRTTLYSRAPAEQRELSLRAAPLMAL